MIVLYASTSPNVSKIILMLEETGLAYAIHPVDVHRGEQFEPQFQILNPNGKVPVIVDQDGPDGKIITVFESGAILLYLAEKSGQFMPLPRAEYYEALQWLMIQLTGVGPVFGQFNHFMRYAADMDYSVDRFTSEVRRLYDLIDARLAQSVYLGGASYSVADIATVPWLRTQAKIFGATHPLLNFGWPCHPSIRRWYEQVVDRTAAQRAFAISDKLPTAQHIASDEERDRYFARGTFRRTLTTK